MTAKKAKPNYLIIPIPGNNHKEHAAMLFTNLSILIHLIYTCCPDYLSRIGRAELLAMRSVIDLQLELKEIEEQKGPNQGGEGKAPDT